MFLPCFCWIDFCKGVQAPSFGLPIALSIHLLKRDAFGLDLVFASESVAAR